MSEPVYKKKWFLSSVVVAAIVSAFVFTNKKSESTVAIDGDIEAFYEEEESKPFINPPIDGLNIPYTIFSVNAGAGGLFDFKTGSMFSVPENAFVDADGNVVSGDVEIRYREFHDAADFFVSGIPMTYDSAGTTYQFESAGMMEMLAFKNGEELTMAAGKTINVELASNYSGTEYNLYKLDEPLNNWSCLGKDKVKNKEGLPVVAVEESVEDPKPAFEEDPEFKVVEAEIVEAKAETSKAISALPTLKAKPYAPKKVNDDKYTFDIAVDPKEFPEIAVFKDVLFEVGAENKSFSKKMYGVVWDEATIKEGTKKGLNYELTLKKSTKKYMFIVYPVFEGADYDVAVKDYQNKFAKYKVALQKRKAAEKRIDEEYQEKLAAFQLRQEAVKRRYEAKMNSRFARMGTEEKVKRLFAINSFGVYNCDNPIAYPTGVTTSAELLKENKKRVACYDIFLVDRQKNALFSYAKNPISKFSFNPESSNLLWTVENGVLYWLKPEQFSTIKSSEGMSKLKMNRVEQRFGNVEEMKTFFNL